MKDCLIDGLIDTIKLLPYLLITFIILEAIEHKLSKKNEERLSKNKKIGPLLGGILGGLPQCGFSAMAANLFSRRVITLGTLIAVFLSTSDEMLPIMISEKTDISTLVLIVVAKIIIGIIIGFLIDLIYKNKTKHNDIKQHCEHEHCHCEDDGIIISSIIHTLKIGLFVLIANLSINLIIYYVAEDNLKELLLDKNIFSYFIASLIGLIPNCAASVIITELYLQDLITIGNLFAGLLTGCGLGLLLLFRTNKNIKENISILLTIYIIGVIIGMIVDLVI